MDRHKASESTAEESMNSPRDEQSITKQQVTKACPNTSCRVNFSTWALCTVWQAVVGPEPEPAAVAPSEPEGAGEGAADDSAGPAPSTLAVAQSRPRRRSAFDIGSTLSPRHGVALSRPTV